MLEAPAILLLFTGLLLLFISSLGLFHILAPLGWHKVKGIITQSGLSSFLSSEEGILSNFYSVKVQYRYQIDGQGYLGNQISRPFYSMVSRNLENCKEFLKRYPLGAEVIVYANDKNPNEAVLVQVDKFLVLVCGTGLLLALFCLYAYVYNVPMYYPPVDNSNVPVE